MFYRFSVNIHNHIIVQFLKCCCSLIILNVSFDNFTHIEYTFENDEALVIIIYLIIKTDINYHTDADFILFFDCIFQIQGIYLLIYI